MTQITASQQQLAIDLLQTINRALENELDPIDAMNTVAAMYCSMAEQVLGEYQVSAELRRKADQIDAISTPIIPTHH